MHFSSVGNVCTHRLNMFKGEMFLFVNSLMQ
jgi:hypothetical protein